MVMPSDHTFMTHLMMLDNQVEPGPSLPSIDPDYDPWKFHSTSSGTGATTLPLQHPSGKVSNHASSLGLDPSRPISSAELRARFPSVGDIPLNWEQTSNSVAKNTLDHPRHSSEEKHPAEFQNVFDPELHRDLDLDLISNPSAFNCLDFSPDPETLKSLEELFGPSLDLDQGVCTTKNVLSEDDDPIRACSSCGILKPHSELSHLRPCLHPHCNTCINTLVNSSCNDPPPPQMICFLCSQPVIGFDLPIAFEIFQDRYQPYSNSSPMGIKIPPTSNYAESFQTALNGLDPVDLKSPSSDLFGLHLGSLSSGRSPVLSEAAMPGFVDELPLAFTTNYSRNSCPWPIVRVDNISWSLTVADIVKWLPDTRCLPPAELCPLPIHILCNPTDGKTLNYCFIEMRNLPAAHLLVRHRHATKIGNRPCSVVLTSPSELHSNILGSNKTDESCHDPVKTLHLILKLCAPHNTSSIKASERAFFHLMSLLAHYEHFPNNQSNPNCSPSFSNDTGLLLHWTAIFNLAVETLLSSKFNVSESIHILRVMVDVGISSPLIDKVAMFEFLSQVEVFFNQISRMRGI